MSNIANTVQFLKGKPERFITITNQDNGKLIGKNAIYIEDVPNEDLETYIKLHLGAITKPTLVWVEMRSKNGATSKKENSCKIEVSPVNYQAPQETPQPQPLPLQEARPLPQPYATPSFLGSPGAGNVFGLGLPEIMGMQRKADLLEDKKEQLLEVKDELKALKQVHALLEIDHRGTLTQLSIAESQKEMAVMLAKAENKSFADSPAFQTLLEKAPELLGNLAALKGGGGIPATAGALGSPDMTETQKQFIEHVMDNLNDNQINFLGSVCHYINNEPFINQLKILIQQQNGAV
ncbi:hypothetical protein SAMN05443667_101253 [Flavobacterium gillisiae]|uniref:Uncharacterized protein n=1 Tax=Flavobacterium gillisiae TaxID=150146 RepID=A0A1H3WVC1_9FLAO|nr:hypothetical protein [Flavobacterium gillisiae]SDZ90920.1 hypothetical protein SAMN05443667_101253 [Flavobacterium gillisiae]